MTEMDILRIARLMKLKSKAADVRYKQLRKLPMPVVVGMKEEGFAVLAQIANDEDGGSKVLILMPDGTPPQIMSEGDFCRKWTGRVLLFTQRFWEEADRKFNLKWFIPTKAVRALCGAALCTLLLMRPNFSMSGISA